MSPYSLPLSRQNRGYTITASIYLSKASDKGLILKIRSNMLGFEIITSKEYGRRSNLIGELAVKNIDLMTETYKKNIDIHDLKIALRDASAEEVEVKKAHRDFKADFLYICQRYGVTASFTGISVTIAFRPVIDNSYGTDGLARRLFEKISPEEWTFVPPSFTFYREVHQDNFFGTIKGIEAVNQGAQEILDKASEVKKYQDAIKPSEEENK